MNKLNSVFVWLFAVVLLFSLPLASALQPNSVGAACQFFDSLGDPIVGANINVSIYDAMSGGNLIYSELFTSATDSSGKCTFNNLGQSDDIPITRGDIYYLDLSVNGEDFNWGSDARLEFRAWFGAVSSVTPAGSSSEVQYRNSSSGLLAATSFTYMDSWEGYVDGFISSDSGVIGFMSGGGVAFVDSDDFNAELYISNQGIALYSSADRLRFEGPSTDGFLFTNSNSADGTLILNVSSGATPVVLSVPVVGGTIATEQFVLDNAGGSVGGSNNSVQFNQDGLLAGSLVYYVEDFEGVYTGFSTGDTFYGVYSDGSYEYFTILSDMSYNGAGVYLGNNSMSFDHYNPDGRIDLTVYSDDLMRLRLNGVGVSLCRDADCAIINMSALSSTSYFEFPSVGGVIATEQFVLDNVGGGGGVEENTNVSFDIVDLNALRMIGSTLYIKDNMDSNFVTFGSNNFVVGSSFIVVDDDVVSLGPGASASFNGIALGNTASAGSLGVTIGYESFSSSSAVAVGESSQAFSEAIVVGAGAVAQSESVAIGIGVNSDYRAATVGAYSQSDQYGSVLGYNSFVVGAGGVALGTSVYAEQEAVGIGRSVDAAFRAVSIGYDSAVTSGSEYSIAIGSNSVVDDDSLRAIAIGYQADITTNSNDAISIGATSGVFGSKAIALGHNANAASESIAIGASSLTDALHSIAIGKDVSSTANDAYAIGRNFVNNQFNSFKVGHNSDVWFVATIDGIVVADEVEFASGAKVVSNSTCLILSSPDGTNSVSLCDGGSGWS